MYLIFVVYPHKDVWTQWSSCSKVCGNSGTRKRIRYCYKATEMCASDEESESCPGTTCPTATTDTNVGEWSEWTSCQLSLDGKSAFQVRNRECSTTDCSDDLQESQSCTHAGLSLGKYLSRNKYFSCCVFALTLKLQTSVLELEQLQLLNGVSLKIFHI